MTFSIHVKSILSSNINPASFNQFESDRLKRASFFAQ
jgi:hypothetical protein